MNPLGCPFDYLDIPTFIRRRNPSLTREPLLIAFTVRVARGLVFWR